MTQAFNSITFPQLLLRSVTKPVGSYQVWKKDSKLAAEDSGKRSRHHPVNQYERHQY